MQLISKFEELSTLDKEIENLIDIESLEEEIVTREEYRDKFIIWKIRAELSSVLSNQPRLPKLTLESFSGKDISSFPSFWARFKSAVHENSSLNDVDKFSYLKSVVTSDAELAIRGLTLTSENYAKAMKILENRFGRKELIVDFHMNRLLNLTPVRKSCGVLLQCVKAEIIGRSSSDKIFCLFDNGSEKSFIKKNVSRRLGLKILGSERLNIFSFGCKTPKKQTCSKVEVRLRNVLSGEETVIEALEIEVISKARLSLPNPDAWAEMESKGFRLTFSCNESSENCEISLLIGSDFYWSLTHRIKKRLDSSLVAVETSLGWSLQGKCDERSDCTSVHLVHSEEESISTELRRFWEIESLGILDKGSMTLGNGDEEILSEFDKSVNFVDGRYRVNLPWKPGMREALQNNKTVARKRFEWLVRRFKCDHELFCEYKDVIDDYVKEGVEWDSELPPKLRHKWQQWSSEAEGLTEIKIPRFYLGNIDQEISKCEIHCFSDASKSAYGTILYLRFVTCNNEIETSFICSKSRVAPLKSLTLPRLELTAALLSARLAKQVSSCLKFDANIYYWTDSLISYYWIRGDSSAFKPYIKNRVQEIQFLSDPMQWGHCPGKDNPADLLSRGTSAVKLAQNELWWHGPPWLKLTPDHWPNRHRDILDSELCSEELEHCSSVHVAVTQEREALVDINRFSSLKKLLKTIAWVFRFVNNARNIYKSMDFYITADEIQNAEYFWLKCVQSEFYSAEILALKQNEQLRSSSEIKSLVPYLDENNLLRLTGRLLEADLCFGEKHPVILPRRCKFTELLVIREHERIGHCGVSATLTQLRKKYWVPKGRQLVKTMIRICFVCKKYSAKPADQLSGQLPRERITQSPPFQIVGIDFTGAMLVKDNQGTRKSYVSLFTCAVTRAVHLELVSDMSTKCFLLALRRFLARRGNCKVIYSDNARTFKAAERELAYFANILKDSEFQNFVADKGIHWKFIVERAPWWGGFYERLVKTIKDPLRKILGRALLTFEELSTILSEVEVIVNHRPLTYVENDPGEPEPLTPAHFLELGYGDSKYPIHFIN
ncbi:integrase catalytic domain-containing protein [Trichonephila clavipes]|nr:integrase catalytic domain-containing protein [Trichonephila clavipes]